MSIIKEFKKEYEFLSNFHQSKVCYEGLIYPTAEHAYQAQKTGGEKDGDTVDENWKTRCQDISPTGYMAPGKIKIWSHKVRLRPDWEAVKLPLMLDIVRAKFSQNEFLLECLLATGTQEIQEGNTWNDVFWGVDLKSGYGENHLGKILMQVRTELK